MRNFTFDDEENILAYYRDSDNRPLAFPQSDDIWKIFQATNDEELWKTWKNSHSKSDLPPDFYNEELKLMMEVMRFDDQATNSGKTHATKAKENQMLEQLRGLGVKEDFPNLKQILLLGNSDLSINDDHNFARYRDNFARVVLKHSKKAEQYRENHPGYKLAFFVFDETSGIYFDRGRQKKSILSKGNSILARPHMYWADSVFVDIINNSQADYFIWFKPYNNFETPLEKHRSDTIKYQAFFVCRKGVFNLYSKFHMYCEVSIQYFCSVSLISMCDLLTITQLFSRSLIS